MNYVLLIVIGTILGSAVNLYAYPDTENRSWIKKWFYSMYKGFKHIVTEMVLVLICFVLYIRFGFKAEFICYLLLFLILTAAAVVDLHRKVIPDKLVLFALIAGVLMMFINTQSSIPGLLAGGVVGGGTLMLLWLISKGSIGLGDVKLFACAGLFLGTDRVLSALLISAVLSGLAGLILVIRDMSNRKKSIPFAPFILIGSLLAVGL